MRLQLTLLLLYLVTSLFAGNDDDILGARSFGLAGNSIQFQDLWSAENNPAGLAKLNAWGAGFSYRNQFLLNELATKSLVAAYPLNNAAFGLSFKQFGFSNYQENKLGLSYGQLLGENISMGIQLSYRSVQLSEGYGSKNAFTGTIGIQAKITEELSFAAVVINPNHTKLAEYEDERIPTVFKLGLGYTFSKKVQVLTELVKDIDFETDVKFGLEYQPIEILHFRVGYASTPSLSSFGFGLEFRQFTIDVASSFDSNLGFSPQVSLYYVPNSRK